MTLGSLSVAPNAFVVPVDAPKGDVVVLFAAGDPNPKDDVVAGLLPKSPPPVVPVFVDPNAEVPWAPPPPKTDDGCCCCVCPNGDADAVVLLA